MCQFSAEAIRIALTTHRLGHPTFFFKQVGSTNDVVHELAAAGATEGLLVVADEQTAGRGRLDRSWWAPRGSSILMSLLLRPPIAVAWAGQLAMCLGLGAVEGIETVTGLHPVLKWPNDILLDGRKLGGMLTELRTHGDRLDYAVLGLGLNVNLEWSPISTGSIPPEVIATATSLAMMLGQPISRLTLLVAILARCEAWYDRLLAFHTEPSTGIALCKAWAARLDTLSRAVAIALPEGTLQGIAFDVTPEGALLVRDDSGRVHTIWTGDVTAFRDSANDRSF